MDHDLPEIFKRVDHIGIVVNSIDDGLDTYCSQLGFTLLERVQIPEQLVEAAFLESGDSTIELIAPTDVDSGTARYLRNRGEGVHHVCFEVGDIASSLKDLREQGLRLIDEKPRRGVHGLVAFVHPKATHGMMIELIQKG